MDAKNNNVTMDKLCDDASILEIDGVKYKITKKKRPPKSGPVQLGINTKCKRNLEEQRKEVVALSLEYKEYFKIVDGNAHKFSITFFIRGGQDAVLEFEFPSLYPSDVPPTYHLVAPWVRESKKKELYRSLSDIFSSYFGRTVIYFWATEIKEVLKAENLHRKQFGDAVEEKEEKQAVPVPEEIKDDTPDIFEGSTIEDRKSSFTPYLAEVHSEGEAQKVLAKLNRQNKVINAWRNTYAYRYDIGGGKVNEVGEDGGEPKAGRSLLQRLINYGANNVLVFLSRKWGGKLLGPDRYKHLNDAADDVLTKCGYKQITCKGKAGAKHTSSKANDKNQSHAKDAKSTPKKDKKCKKKN